MKKWVPALAGVMMILLCAFAAGAAESGVILRLTAENPSDLESKQVMVRSYLPAGVRPENILDKGGLEVGYDVKQGQYYIYKDVTLAPLESATYQIEVQDIWQVNEKQLSDLKAHSRELTAKLKKSEYSVVAQKLDGDINRDIDIIVKRQAAASIDKVSAVEHINAYEANKKVFDNIKSDMGTIENLVIGTGGDVGKVMGESSVGSKALDEVASEAEESVSTGNLPGGGIDEVRGEDGKAAATKQKTITLKIEVTNPSKTETRSIPVTYYLPQEIRKDDIIDPKELEPRLDFEKSQYYLYSPGVPLNPGESRVFDVVIRDKWSVSETKLLALKLHAAAMVASLEGTKEFAAVEGLGNQVMDKIDDVMNKKTPSTISDDNIANFRAEQNELSEIENGIGRMEDLLRQTGITPKLTVLDQKKLKQLAESSGVSEQRLKQIQDMLIAGKSDYGTGPDVKGVKMLAGTMFRGKAPSTATTWKIIYIILTILGIVSIAFYFSQIEQQQIAMFDNLTGAFTRKYIMERFKEELKIAKGNESKCSLLLFDIDKFKNINDTHGHTIGDIILKEFVIAIRKGIRATDLIGRFGGDEFLVVLPTAEKKKAKEIAENIRKLIEEHNIKIEDKAFKVTSSIGVTTYPVDSMTAEDLFNKSDKAMYESKAKGGNSVSEYV